MTKMEQEELIYLLEIEWVGIIIRLGGDCVDWRIQDIPERIISISSPIRPSSSIVAVRSTKPSTNATNSFD